MRLGIKVANNQEDVKRLEKTAAECCEVRFILEIKEEFKSILDYCLENKIQLNFHHWAAFDGILANPAAPGKLGLLTVDSIKETVNIAGKYNAGYVVIHPGHTMRSKIDHKSQCIRPVETIATLEEAEKLLIKRISMLHEYARKRGLVLITETVPRFDPEYWMSAKGRLKTIDIGSLPLSTIAKLADAGFYIANDFEHTCSHKISNNRSSIYKYLYQKTKKLALRTKLLHLGYLIPPYNGTDYHGDLSNPEFNTNQALPNKKETIELLQIFKDRSDVWVIPEPQTDHIGSYFVAQELISTL